MHALFILILITTIEARRASFDLPMVVQPNYNVFNSYGNNERSERVQQGVDFGHVYRNGFRDPAYNQQFDLEREMPEPKHSGKMRDILKNSRQSKDFNLDGQALVFLSPRDEFLHYKKYNKSFTQIKSNEETSSSNKHLKPISQPTGYDFVQLLERNLAYPFTNRGSKSYKEKYYKKLGKVESKVRERNEQRNSSANFEEKSFHVKPNSEKLNWTTCNEFAKRAVFHPDDVVNTEWLPFYIWSTSENRIPAMVHTFAYPTKKTVQFYKSTYGPYIRKLNWKEPKLLLKESRDILLIAGDRRGLFYGIPKQEVPSAVQGKNITMPLLSLRMKIHDPYLAMTFCEVNYAIIMAELGTEPKTDNEKTLEASTLKFKGIGHTAYRDLEGEALLDRMERLRKVQTESRKMIQITKPSGDVDIEVRH